MESYLLIIGLALGLVIAAITDVRSGRIPNWLTLSLAGFGLTVHTMYDGWNGLFFSLEGLGLGIVCLLFFYIKGGMGAGDVKLLGAIGTFLGPGQVVFAFAFAAMLGGLYSLALLFNQGGLRHVRDRVFLLLSTLRVTHTAPVVDGHHLSPEPKLRYALVLGLGTVIAKIFFYYGVL